MKTYLRKRQVANRYGRVHPRSIERAVRDGRLPPPEYPLGPNVPFWDEAALDEHDRAAAVDATFGPAPRRARRARP
jgi:hypothetical protein